MSFQSPVAEYLDALARELAFDPALSRRVRHEIEDHLHEAIAAEVIESAGGAEGRVIDRFGSPQEIAAPYKAVSLHRRSKRAAVRILGAILIAFAAMESRVAWYGLMQWQVAERLKLASETILPIDRYAFLIAIVLGILGSIYTMSRSIPASGAANFRTQLRFGQFLIAGAAGAISVAVASEALLTSWRLLEAPWSAAALFPAGSFLGEVGIVAAALLYLCITIRRASAIFSHKTGA